MASENRSTARSLAPAAMLGVGRAARTEPAIRESIDAFASECRPSYRVGDERVRAAPQFRMVTGYNGTPQHDAGKILKALGPNAPKNGELALVVAGRGSPAQVASVTQKLIDAGHLPARLAGETAEECIQRMQWSFGVGMDCAGCVQQAFLRSRGATAGQFGLGAPMVEDLSRLDRNPRFRELHITRARAGDLIALDRPPGDSVGHVVLVASHAEVPPGSLPPMSAPQRAAAVAFLGKGGGHAYELDASWGAGEHGLGGGVQRKVWLHREGDPRWGYFDGQTGELRAADQPYDHPLKGVFRPRDEP